MYGTNHAGALTKILSKARLFSSSKLSSSLMRRARWIEAGQCKPGLYPARIAKGTRPFQSGALLSSAPDTALQVMPSPSTPPMLSLLRQHLGLEQKTDAVFASGIPLDPVFICIDVEAFEFNQSRITEVGIATVDSRGLTDLTLSSPAEWLRKIDARHFIIRENRRFVNRKFVKGCPHKFRFGRSQVVPLSQMENILKRTFTIDDPSASTSDQTRRRKVVLVGHELQGDVKYLNNLGFSLSGRPEILAGIDSRKIAEAVGLPQNLERLLRALGEKPEYLHNGGNDAAYTLHSALLMALYGCILAEPPTMENARQVILKEKEEQMIKQQEHNRRQQELAEKLKEAKKEERIQEQDGNGEKTKVASESSKPQGERPKLDELRDSILEGASSLKVGRHFKHVRKAESKKRKAKKRTRGIEQQVKS